MDQENIQQGNLYPDDSLDLYDLLKAVVAETIQTPPSMSDQGPSAQAASPMDRMDELPNHRPSQHDGIISIAAQIPARNPSPARYPTRTLEALRRLSIDELSLIAFGWVGRPGGGETLWACLEEAACFSPEIFFPIASLSVLQAPGSTPEQSLFNISRSSGSVKDILRTERGFFVVMGSPIEAQRLVHAHSEFCHVSLSSALHLVSTRFPSVAEEFAGHGETVGRQVNATINAGLGSRLHLEIHAVRHEHEDEEEALNEVCIAWRGVVEGALGLMIRSEGVAGAIGTGGAVQAGGSTHSGGSVNPGQSLNGKAPPLSSSIPTQQISDSPPMTPNHTDSAIPPTLLPLLVQLKAPLAHFDLVQLVSDPENISLLKRGQLGQPLPGIKVVPLRWSTAHPFAPLVLIRMTAGCVSHGPTCTACPEAAAKLAVARTDAPMEAWGVLWEGELPKGKITSFVDEGKCKLVIYGGTREESTPLVYVLHSPIEGFQLDGAVGGESLRRLRAFYLHGSLKFLAQYKSGKVAVLDRYFQVTRNPHSLEGLIPWDAKVFFFYIRVGEFNNEGNGILTCAAWMVGVDLMTAISDPSGAWRQVSTIPLFPLAKIGFVYPPLLAEPLLLVASADPKILGLLQVWRLGLVERLFGQSGLADEQRTGSLSSLFRPRLLKQLGMPKVRCSLKDLTTDLFAAGNEDMYRNILGAWKFLPGEGDEDRMAVQPDTSSYFGRPLPIEGMFPGGVGVSNGPTIVNPPSTTLGVLQSRSSFSLFGLSTTSSDLEFRILSEIAGYKVTPLRWANASRDGLFALVQQPKAQLTIVYAVQPDGWIEQLRTHDSAGVPFSTCRIIPVFAKPPGKETPDLFLITLDGDKGGLFMVSSPRDEWRFVREISEKALLYADRIDVMYHRSRDERNPLLLTFLLTQTAGNMNVRLLGDPFKESLDICSQPWQSMGLPSITRDLTILYSCKPCINHAWPCDVFIAWIEGASEGSNLDADGYPTGSAPSRLMVAHCPLPDARWRVIIDSPAPNGSTRVVPLYLEISSEPLLLLNHPRGVDLIRPNLVDALTGFSAAAGAALGYPRFIKRWEELGSLIDITMDLPLSWLPIAANNCGSYFGVPFPFEQPEGSLNI